MIVFCLGCQAQPNPAEKSQVNKLIDSCSIAKPFEMAIEQEESVAPDYSGEVIINDTIKPKQKIWAHYFQKGKLVKSLHYEDGKIKEVFYFKCSSLNGYHTIYGDKGKLLQEIPFSYGYLNGT